MNGNVCPTPLSVRISSCHIVCCALWTSVIYFLPILCKSLVPVRAKRKPSYNER